MSDTSLNESELRNATIMFADISGFTALSETLSPEDVTNLMNQCFDLMSPIIRRNEGIIDKFIGDCAMVLFGAPSAIKQAPLKAVNTAIAVRNAIHQFSSSQNLPSQLDIHIGINSGAVLAGHIGSSDRKQYTVIGDAVNLASRLEELSGTGQILVGEATYQATKNIFLYNESRPTVIKGKKEEVRIYELLSQHTIQKRVSLSSERMIESVMVGRDRERQILDDAAKTLEKGRGRIVNIIGEAGIGKSRLISEFQHQIPDTTRLVEGRSLSYGRNLSFHPFIEIVKSLAGMGEDDTQPQMAEKLELLLAEYCSEEVSEIFPYLATLLGIDIPQKYQHEIEGVEGEILSKLVFINVRALLSSIAKRLPVVVVLEDMHWADSSSIELLESLFPLVREHRLLFILLFRPDYRETGVRIRNTLVKNFEDDHIEIEVQPLDAYSSDVLIHNLLKMAGIPPAIREQIKKRSEGNPFFIEEILRSFIDDGIIELRNGGFSVTQAIDHVVIPNTLQELLMARIDRLDASSKTLVKTASVIGRNFMQKIIVEVASSVVDILDKLEYLKDVQLIREGMQKDEIEYLFKHALAQKAAYESILVQQRKDLHWQVASAIERIFEEKLSDFYGMLAYHYGTAEDIEKAEEYLLKAGKEALKSSASGEAIRYFSEALSFYRRKYGQNADPEMILEMNKNLAFAYHFKGQQFDAMDYIDAVLTQYGLKPSTKQIKHLIDLIQSIICTYLPKIAWKKPSTGRDVEIARFFLIRASIISTEMPERMLENAAMFRWLTKFDPASFTAGADVFSILSVVLSYGGLSFRISKKVLEFVNENVDHSDVMKDMYTEFANRMHYYLTGEWTRIAEYNPERPSRYIKGNQIMYYTFYDNMYLLYFIETGEYDKAEKLYQQISDTCSRYDYNAVFRGYGCKLYMKYRFLGKVIGNADIAIKESEEANEVLNRFSTHCFKARAQILNGDLRGAEDTLQIAANLSSDIPPFHMTDYVTARLQLDVTVLEQALSSKTLRVNAYTSTKRANRTTNKAAVDRVEIFRLTGIYHWLTGAHGKAVRWWQRSISVGKIMGAKLELSRTYAEVGKRLCEPQSSISSLNGTTASEYMAKAKLMFEEMDLTWDLRRLEVP